MINSHDKWQYTTSNKIAVLTSVCLSYTVVLHSKGNSVPLRCIVFLAVHILNVLSFIGYFIITV